MPPKKARRSSRNAPASGRTKAEDAKPAPPERSGPPRVLCAADVRLGGIDEGLPPLPGDAAAIAAHASLRLWDALLEAAPGADALLLTGRLLDPAADLRAERALREGLERLAAADVTAFAITRESLPADLPLTRLAPDEPSDTEIARGGRAVAALRVLAGAATFPVPDGLPALGVTADPAADPDGCDALFTAPGEGPATLLTLPETAGAGGAQSEPRCGRPIRRFAPVLDLPDEPPDLPDRLREAAPRRRRGERLRIVDWTLRVGPWGDALTAEGADALAAALSAPDAVHSVTVLPHPDRFADDGERPGEAAAFLEALAHFDPVGDGDAVPALAGVAPDPERVRALATRFAVPLLTTS